MKKLVIAAFALFAVPALAIPHGFSAVKNAQSLNQRAASSQDARSSDSRADRSDRSNMHSKTENPRADKGSAMQDKAPEANR